MTKSHTQSNNKTKKKTFSIESPTIFAQTTFRHGQTPFGIKRSDRRFQILALGKTGVGKSSLIKSFALDDAKKGYGFALFDPHGDLVAEVRKQIPWSRADDVIDFDLTRKDQPYGFNPLGNVPQDKRPLACSGMIQVFKYLWRDSWGPRLEHILRNSLLTLLDYKNATLADTLKLLTDKDFRKKVMPFIQNEQVRKFWMEEFEKYPARLRADAIAPIQNKVGAFISYPLLQKVLTSPEKPLNLRRIMDEEKILLINLSKGELGVDTANLLGSLLVSRFDLAALSRSNIPEDKRRDFTLFLDEFPSFIATDNLASMLSELRKYRVSLFLSTQHLSGIEQPLVRDSILGNVGTIISFRIGATDAELLAQEFYPEFKPSDFTSLPNYHIYLRMMIDGSVSRPFSAKTLPPSKQ